jgi:hypothetical protein
MGDNQNPADVVHVNPDQKDDQGNPAPQVMSPNVEALGNASVSFTISADDKLKADGSNYMVWSKLVKIVLTETGVVDCINADPQGNDAAVARKEAKAQRLIIMSVSGDLKSFLVGIDGAKAMWQKLESLFKPSSMADALMVAKQFRDAVYKDYASMREYLNALRLFQAKLTGTGYEVKDDQLIFQAFTGLPRSYGMTIRILSSKQDLDWATTSLELTKEESRQKLEDEKSDAVALKARRYDQKSNKTVQAKAFNSFHKNMRGKTVRDGPLNKKAIKCWYCDKVGHMEKDCRLKKSRTNTGSQVTLMANENKNSTQITLMTDTEARQTRRHRKATNWILDSGASSHMTGDRSLLMDFKPRTGVIKTANGLMSITGSGKIMARILPEKIDVTITEVLYVEGLKYNLLSIGAMAAKGCKCEIGSDRANISFENGQGFSVPREHGLYYAIMSTVFEPKVDTTAMVASIPIQDFHQTMAHAGERTLKETAK